VSATTLETAGTSPKAAPDGGFSAIMAARRFGGRGWRRLLALQCARTLSRLAFFSAAAIVVGLLVMEGTPPPWLLVCLPFLLLLLLAIGWVADRHQAAAEAAVAGQLRTATIRRLQTMAGPDVRALSAGHLTVALQRYPDALAALVVGHRAASAMMAIGPLLAAASLAMVSWQAALLILVLTPVMIVFFALVGETIRRRADQQERSLSRLADQFADRVRTMPTILANDGLAIEEKKLAERLAIYAANTMHVLRIAFLNAAIIDFFASLSIAMLAVFLGLGHLKLAMIPGFSNLELWQSLFVLMIAPEYYAPFRKFSEQYHVRAEGSAAAQSLDRLLAAPPLPPIAVPALDGLDLSLPSSGLVAICGPSGAGKSTLLRRLAGIDPSHQAAAFAGHPIRWISTDAYIPAGTVREALLWGDPTADEITLRMVAGSAGLLDEALLPGGLDAPLLEGGANLSGGQRMRIAVARAALGTGAVLADEPTAKLDAATADAVRRMLQAMAAARLVVVATHDERLANLADDRITLAGEPVVEGA
jgi:ATP-binding cassette subfamily C protein